MINNIMEFKKFEKALSELDHDFQDFVPFKGNIEEVIVLEGIYDRENASYLIEQVTAGKTFTTKHIASKSDLTELGLQVENFDHFLFDKPTSFTQSVLIPL